MGFEFGPFEQASTNIFTGERGSGKSYMATYYIIMWLEAKHPVITNLQIFNPPNPEFYYRYDQDVDFTPRPVCGCDLVKAEKGLLKENPGICPRCKTKYAFGFFDKIKALREKHPGTHLLVVVDEAPDIFGARQFATFPKEIGFFIRQQRKLRVSTIAIAQRDAGLFIDFRRGAHRFRRHWHCSCFPVVGFLFHMVHPHLHYVSSREPDEHGKPDKKSFDRKLYIASKRVFKHYDTMQVFGIASAGAKPPKERSIRGYLVNWLGLYFIFWTVKWLLVSVIGGFFISLVTSGLNKHKDDVKKESPAVEVHKQLVSGSQATTTTFEKKVEKKKDGRPPIVGRLAGYEIESNKRVLLLEMADGQLITLDVPLTYTAVRQHHIDKEVSIERSEIYGSPP